MKFRINFGRHWLGGKCYGAGDTIETEHDLTAIEIYDVERQSWKFTKLEDDPTPPPFRQEKET